MFDSSDVFAGMDDIGGIDMMGWGGGSFGSAFGNPFAVSSFGFDPFTTIGGGGGADDGLFDNVADWFGGSGGSGIPLRIPTGSSGPDINEQLTAIVNAAERALQFNLAAWQQSQLSGQAALDRGWQLMNAMVEQCARFGQPGMNSAAERDRRIDPTRLRWDWIAYYLDPITGGPSQPATLPGVVSGFTPAPGSGPINPVYGAQGFNAYLWAGVGLIALILIMGARK